MYFYVYNLQGDVTHILDADANIVGTYTYDAWGKITNLSSLTSIAQTNPFRYRGYYYDNESGLYYLNSRYYNPDWGRFISADILLATDTDFSGTNLFSYCGNNPVSRVDSDGNFWNTIVGGVIGGITGVVGAAISGDNIWAGLGIGTLTGAISGFATDLAIATGGIGAFVAVIAIESLSSGANYALTEVANNRKINGFELATDMIIGAAMGAIDFGLADGSLKKRSGNVLDNLVDDFNSYMTPKQKKVAGKVVNPTKQQCAKHTVKNIISDASISVVINGGADLYKLKMEYWGKT